MERILPQSGIDFLNDLESREKALSKILDDISDACFSGTATLDEIIAKRNAFFDLMETIEMDIGGMIREMDLVKNRFNFFAEMLNPLLALFAGSVETEKDILKTGDVIYLAVNRNGIRYNHFYDEDD